MQTLIVVRLKVGMIPDSVKKQYRKDIIKQMKEGLVVIDDDIEITSHTINGEVGIEFNEEEENEKESI